MNRPVLEVQPLPERPVPIDLMSLRASLELTEIMDRRMSGPLLMLSMMTRTERELVVSAVS